MKLLVIVPSRGRGGAEEYALTVSSAAIQAQWEVHLAFAKMRSTESLVQDASYLGVKCHPFTVTPKNQNRFELLVNFFLWFTQTFFLLLKIQPNVVLINLPSPLHCFSSMVACTIFPVPAIVVVHLITGVIPLHKIKLRIYSWLRSKKQVWVTVSEYSRKLICETFQATPDEITCIYNGVKICSSLESEDTATLRGQVRQELDVSPSSRIVLTVAQLRTQKGHRYLIPAIPHIIQKFPDVKFVWLGDGDQRDQLCEQIRDLGIEEYVLLLGHRSDVPKFLRSADLFVFPTCYEGLPFALLEAMICDLPIVTSNTSGIPEIVLDQVHGLLFRTGDSEHLAETVCWALENPDRMQEMAKNARLRVENLSEERMTDKVLQVLEDQAYAH